MNNKSVSTTRIFVLQGGMLPLKQDKNAQRAGDVGINLSVRAVIGMESPEQQSNRKVAYERRTLFDFLTVAADEVNENVIRPSGGQGFRYTLHPGETVSLGLGVVVEVMPGYAWYVEPRSSTVKKHGRNCVLSVLNAHVPGDPGFRAEIWAELHNHGPERFEIHRHMVLFQLVRKRIDDSVPLIVDDFSQLSQTERGIHSNGSTDPQSILKSH